MNIPRVKILPSSIVYMVLHVFLSWCGGCIQGGRQGCFPWIYSTVSSRSSQKSVLQVQNYMLKACTVPVWKLGGGRGVLLY